MGLFLVILNKMQVNIEKYMYRYLINWALYLIKNLWEILFIFLGVRGCHQRWVYCHHGNPQMSEIHDNSPRETTVGGHCHRTGRTRRTLCSMFLCLQSFCLTSFKIIVRETLIQQFIPKMPERQSEVSLTVPWQKKYIFSFPIIFCLRNMKDLSLHLLDWLVFVYCRHQIQTVLTDSHSASNMQLPFSL